MATSAAQPASAGNTPTIKEGAVGQLSVTLVPTVKPITPAYAGITPDILGVRVGMTVSQAEAIAAKAYPGKPNETKDSLSVKYGGTSAQSQSFISKVVFKNGADDVLTLDFTNPATGNVVYAIERAVTFEDASKQPLMTVVTSDLVDKYGPAMSMDAITRQYGSVSDIDKSSPQWQFGEQNLQFFPTLAQDNTRIWAMTLQLLDYQLRNESTTTGHQQLVAAVEAAQKTKPAKPAVPSRTLSGIYVSTAETTPAIRALKQNATNLLDVTGMVTARAIVVACVGDDGMNAMTLTDSDNGMFFFNGIPNGFVDRYGVGPVTYDGKTLNIDIQAYGKPPSTTNADVSLTQDTKANGVYVRSGNTLIGGSIAIAATGYTRAYTFHHATLKLMNSQAVKLPPDATVTIDGKVFCGVRGNVPLPQALIDKIPAGSMEFASDTVVYRLTRLSKAPATYKINGNTLIVTTDEGNFDFQIDSNGCLDGPDNSKFCKK